MKIKELIFFALIIMFVLNTTINIRWNPPNKVNIKYVRVHDTIYVDTTYIISHVSVTVYQPVESQCDRQPLITSDGSKIDLKSLKNGNTIDEETGCLHLSQVVWNAIAMLHVSKNKE